MNVAIIGTGGVALATAALLARTGHSAILVSVSGKGARELRNREITAEGAFEMAFTAEVTEEASTAFERADAVILATSADRYGDALDCIIPHLTGRHMVLVSGELSQIAGVIEAKTERMHKRPTITALSTTLATGRRGKDALVSIGIVRKSAQACTRPHSQSDQALDFWNSIFGDVLSPSPGALHLTLSNLNPIVHVPNALCNFTRIEKGEEWSNYGGITDGVAKLIVALDNERMALADAFSLSVKSFKQNYEDSFQFPSEWPLSRMTVELNVRRNGLPLGPSTKQTRYLTEDIPFGLVVFEKFGVLGKVPTPMISAAITLVSSIYDKDFRTNNPFLNTLAL